VKRVLAYLAILVVIAGCSLGESLQDPGDHVDMTASTLAGTWHGGTQRFITFQEDGTFSAINVPNPPFRDFLNSIGFDPARDRADGSGTWTLEGLSGESAAPRATVRLHFKQLAGVRPTVDGFDLEALRPADGRLYLVVFYIDQGNSWTGYLKCASDCVLPSPVTSSPSHSGAPSRSGN
jgi:hypothetical protein